MRFMLILTLLVTSIYAVSVNTIVSDYKKKRYTKVCTNGYKVFLDGKGNEHLWSLVGDACLKVDAINPLGVLQKSMIYTKDGRANASIFATLILQKKLIYQFMIDDHELSNYRLPRTAHILSVVFEKIVMGDYELVNYEPKKIVIEDEDRTLEVSVLGGKKKRVNIDILNRRGVKVKTHWFQ
jgi:hypothetical protein